MRIVILGGGISGLSAAWVLRGRGEVVLLEKERVLGGKIGEIRNEEVSFETGPRIFPVGRSPYLLRLIQEVELDEEILIAGKRARKRYIWTEGKLRSLGSFWPQILWALCKEPFQPQGNKEDESIAEFGRRRFGSFVTEKLLDPMALGIFGGSIEELSMRSCFPSLFDLEKEKGSLFPHLFLRKKGAKGLFTLRRGMSSLIERLAERSGAEIRRGEEVESIVPEGVIAGGKLIPADLVISALPLSAIGKLTRLWPDAKGQELTVTHLAYRKVQLPKQGFGYLIPSQEKEDLLGMIWDSSLSPESGSSEITRMTVIQRKPAPLQEVVKRHLSIWQEPFFTATTTIPNAIPHFPVGYSEKLARFEYEVKAHYPRLQLVGNYLSHPSVEGCIAKAFALFSVGNVSMW